ncbi:MAG: peptidylprolyl isomerase [Prevotella sp.]|jgi:peptidyl-prolyl cis-trans isomerase D
MAVLGRIRRRGTILIIIIGLGLFAFIAEEAFRSCETTKNNQRQQIGEVLGEKVNAQDFQQEVEDFTEYLKVAQGIDNLNDQQLQSLRDQVWGQYVQNKIIEDEASKLGLRVTDDEMQNVLREGTHPMLQRTPFTNQQTGRFDANALQKFLAEYKQNGTNPQYGEQYQMIYKYWTFLEKNLRQTLLATKYQSLIQESILSNPIEAKMAFKDQNEESSIQLAALPYSSIQDSKVQISESDMKAKYDELKDTYYNGRFGIKQLLETRDISYIDVPVVASAKDRAALQKAFATYAQQLAAAENPSEVVRKSTSLVSYLGVPVSKGAFPSDIAAKLDSMAVGQTTGVFENKQDNTLNIIKLVSKTSLPDSVQFRAIQVASQDVAKAHKSADSIFNALKANPEQFEAIAKKYGQTGEKTWMTNSQYEQAPSIDEDTKKYILALFQGGLNELQNVVTTQGNIILQVLDRKAMNDKYMAAVVKKTIDYSNDTHTSAYNKFSAFLSANQTPDALEKNAAKNGYKYLDQNDLTSNQHYVAGIPGTTEALRWVFNDAKDGQVSKMFEAGNNGDHLIVVVLNKIHPVGNRGLDDPQVKEWVKSEVMKDKKAEMLMAKLKGVNSINAAKAKGANVSTVNQITFASPVTVQSLGASEFALSGAVAATAKGKFSSKPVKGEAGVYVFQVVNKTNRPVKFDEKQQEMRCRQMAMQTIMQGFGNELMNNADVVDNRYNFF